MTIKEAILKSLEDLEVPSNHLKVYDQILKCRYYTFSETAKTPLATISAQLGDFIRNGDSRVKRIKESATYSYYLTKKEQDINIDALSNAISPIKTVDKAKNYDERDLHKLLSSYLKSSGIYSKTIYHESSNAKDNNQIWTHPDVVGIRFLNLQTKASQAFLKAINRVDTFKVSSYEIKKEINTDSELKKAFFQAVSNSSWANYGYLVAFEISESLNDEMERLNQSFGIGVIKLKANPYESKVLFTPKYRDLDFKTIDKLCNINSEFNQFIEHAEKLMTADDRYVKATEKELDTFCDSYFNNDSEIEAYCKLKNIPFDMIEA